MLRSEHLAIDDRAVELIAARVAAVLRDDLEALLALRDPRPVRIGMTVGEVAARLGVARSTVYAHWRDWGGYKLGPGDKAPIRFDGDALPTAVRTTAKRSAVRADGDIRRAPRRRRRGGLVGDAPRLAHSLDEAA